MLTVDIVSPLGGDVGGVENVILKWTKEFDEKRFNLRIFHCYIGGAYLQGYEKQWSIDKDFQEADLGHLINAYSAFINKMCAPDICIATNWPMMVLACAYVRQQMHLEDLKIISWVHSNIATYEKEGLGGVKELINADAHFAISHQVAKDILAADTNAKVFEIGNPVDLLSLPPEESYDPYLLTFVGRLSLMKHVDVILDAMALAQGPWKLRVIGEGDARNLIEERVRLLHLGGQVEILGWHENPWALCKDSRILVVASDYEGFHIAACEAASAGKTILSTPVDGLVDYVIPGETGYFYPFGDRSALADILNQIEAGDISLGDPAACRRSVERYDTKAYFQKVMQILDEVGYSHLQ